MGAGGRGGEGEGEGRGKSGSALPRIKHWNVILRIGLGFGESK